MIAIYDRKTKEIVVSFPDAFWLDPKITISHNGKKPDSFEKITLNDELSTLFTNPKSGHNIHDHEVVVDKNGKAIGIKRFRGGKNLKSQKIIPL